MGNNFYSKMIADLPSQFKEKSKIEGLIYAVSKQLNEITDCHDKLNAVRALQTAVGKQLDGIGEIVVLSREEATQLALLSSTFTQMNDDVYRLYLAFKIFVNTSNSTYADVYRAIKMFWDKPFFYAENPDYPATIFLSIATLSANDNFGLLLIAPIIKAAGVALHFIISAEYDNANYHASAIAENTHEFFYEEVEIYTNGEVYHAGITSDIIREFFYEDTSVNVDITNYAVGAVAELMSDLFIGDASAIPTDNVNYDAVAEELIIREYFMEQQPIKTASTQYNGGAAHIKLKEVYRDD